MISAVLSSVFPVVSTIPVSSIDTRLQMPSLKVRIRNEVFPFDLQQTRGEAGVVKSDKQTAIFHTAAPHILLPIKGGYKLSLKRIEVSKPEGS